MVAAVGLREMLTPVMIVIVAVAVFVVSTVDVAVTVALGSGVTVPEIVAVGMVAGAVYRPFVSIVPHPVTVTLLTTAQVTVQVTVVVELPVTREANCWVVLVMTLAAVGEIVRTTVDAVLLPQPAAQSASTRINSEQNFHRLIPILPKVLDIGSGSTGFST